jgi:hypothetical protein
MSKDDRSWVEERDESLYPIDHNAIMDGLSELAKHKHYIPFDTFCGICGEACHVTSREQKYILEVRGVPAKMLRRGAVFCDACLERRVKIKGLRQHHHDKGDSAGKLLLKKLIAEEDELKMRPREISGDWPY